jgi:lipoyl(octanoyl) transferase
MESRAKELIFMQERYRFVVSEPLAAATNMAIDEAIHLHHLRGAVPPTLRVFRWRRPAISLGRFQSIEREIDAARVDQLGVVLVRRPTGGRAVYHRDEFTYSIVIGKSYGVPSGVVAAYAYLARGLLAALQNLGIAAVLSDEHVNKHPSAACFASSTQADLTSNGFKLVGSAQVWKDDALLQQGSLPLAEHAGEFFSMLRYPSEDERGEALRLYREKTTPLHSFRPGATWEEAARAFHAGFSSALGAEFVPAALTQSELELAEQLVAEKYSKLEWRAERVRLIS